MRDARLIETSDVPLDEIAVGDRLRNVSEAALEGLEASVDELGVVLDEIHLRRVRHQDDQLVLMAGGHRLALARRKGWKTIRAKVWDCTDNWAALVEIDDNLAHAELAPLELARFLAERKRIYEKLHPEAKAGVAGANARWHAGDTMSFASSIAEKRDISERHVQRLIAVGEVLTDEMYADLNATSADTSRTVSLADLQALAKLSEPEDRKKAIADFCADPKLPKLKGVVAGLQETAKPPKDPAEEGFKALLTAWKRAPKAARKRFVSEENVELFNILRDIDGGLSE